MAIAFTGIDQANNVLQPHRRRAVEAHPGASSGPQSFGELTRRTCQPDAWPSSERVWPQRTSSFDRSRQSSSPPRPDSSHRRSAYLQSGASASGHSPHLGIAPRNFALKSDGADRWSTPSSASGGSSSRCNKSLASRTRPLAGGSKLKTPGAMPTLVRHTSTPKLRTHPLLAMPAIDFARLIRCAKVAPSDNSMSWKAPLIGQVSGVWVKVARANFRLIIAFVGGTVIAGKQMENPGLCSWMSYPFVLFGTLGVSIAL